MADNIENHYHQRPQRSDSSTTGWVIGVIVALLAILALWYYGTQRDIASTTTNNTTPTLTTQPH